MKNIIIKKLNSKEEIAKTFSILTQHHKHIKRDNFLKNIDDILAEKNYQMIAAYKKDEELLENMIGIAGYWILTRFYSDKYIQIGNMVVDQNHRGLGIGKALLEFVEKEGKKQNCQHFILDSRLENKKSHKFYLREGFEIMGYHFMKDL